MTKTSTKIFLFALAFVCLVCVVLAIPLAPTASADAVTYVSGTIGFDQVAYADSGYAVKVNLWTAADKGNWQVATLGQLDASLVYYGADGQRLQPNVRPTAVGTYTVKVVLGANCPEGLQTIKGVALSEGSVVASLSYRVVDRDVNVVFAPAEDIHYDGQDHYHEVLDGTTVYRNGAAVTEGVVKRVTVRVDESTTAEVTELINAGVYHVEVTEGGHTYTSTFNVRRAISDVVSIVPGTMYEGMHTTYDRTDIDPAARRAEMLADRTRYYTPTLAGALTEGGRIKAMYTTEPDPAVRISYWDGGIDLGTAPPVTAGDYVCRIRVLHDIAELGLAAGDNVDLPYTVRPAPYQAVWNKTADANGAVYVRYVGGSSDGVKVFVRELLRRSDSSHMQPAVGEPIYFRGTDIDNPVNQMSNEQVAGGITAAGIYTAVCAIDVSTPITGADYFGDADADFVINASNKELVCTFEVIVAYDVTYNLEGVRAVYYNNVTAYARQYITAHNEAGGERMSPVSELAPKAVYNHSSLANATITYTYEGSATFPDADPVNLDTIKSKMLVGRYEGLITFGNNVGRDGNNNVVEVTRAGDVCHFSFAIDTVPIDSLANDADNYEAAYACVQSFCTKMGVTPAQCDIAYYRMDGALRSAIAPADVADVVCYDVGRYAARIAPTVGAFVGRTYELVLTRRSTATTDSIRFEFTGLTNFVTDYTGSAIAAVVDFGEGAPAVSHSLYYQRQEGANWVITSVPVDPGTYRAVLRFNEPSVYFNASYGTTISREFTILPLTLTARAQFVSDSVYDGTSKMVGVQFYVGGKPMSDADMAAFDYTIYYSSKVVTPEYTTDRPLAAGSYAVGVVFNSGSYVQYGIQSTALTPDEILDTYGDFGEYLMRTDNNLVVAKLILDTVVTVPVGYHAMYTGAQILPTYAFYKGNEGRTDGATLAESIASQTALDAFGVSLDTYFTVNSARTALGSNFKIDDSLPIETGKYDRLLTLRDTFSGNIYFGRVAIVYDGAPTDGAPAITADVVEGTDGAQLNVGYYVNALPITLSILEDSFVWDGDVFTAYYGESAPRTPADLVVHTLDQDGNVIPLVSPDLSAYVSLRCYTRRSGNNDLATEATAGEDGLYAKGSYMLRITFAAPANEDVATIYSHYSLAGGVNTAEGLLAGKCYYDIPFDVSLARRLRVVFDPDFASYTFDGTAKTFTVRFVAGEDDVSADFVAGVDYRVTYGDSVESAAVGTQDADSSYNIKVTFLRSTYHYYVRQYVGTYSNEGSGHILAGDTVIYDFVVTRVRYLSWAWNDADGKTQYYYNGEGIRQNVRFVSDTTYNARAAAVSLVKGTDYDVWYYAVTDVGYTRLYSLPVTPGHYVAELVFLRDLADFRYMYEGNGLVVYGYATADASFVPGSVAGGVGYYFGRSLMSSGILLNREGRYFAFDIERPTLRVTGLRADSKMFDNTTVATVNSYYRLVAEDGATIVTADVAALRRLLNTTYTGRFASIRVGEGLSVYYQMTLGEATVTMPHAALCAAATQTGTQYWVAALDALGTEWPAETMALIADARAVILSVSQLYEVYFDDVTADITKGRITVVAQKFERRYDEPDGELTYTISASDLAKLQALLPREGGASAYFVGNLTRENADVYDINEEGYLIVAGEDFAFVADEVRLSDDSFARLADLYDYHLTRALYYITPCAITVGLEGNRVTAVYGDADTMLDYRVLHGALREGDTLVYVGTAAEQRVHKKEIDDVGSYNVLFNQLRVMRHNIDVTANYRISYRAAEYVITPMEVILTPVYGKAVYYMRDAFEPTNVGCSRRDGDEVIGFDDLDTRFHATIQHTFGRVEAATTDPTVYKCYNVTLGTNRIVAEDGTDLTRNFTFTLGPNTRQFVVRKYSITLAVEGDLPAKFYGEPDPSVALTDYRHSLADLGFHVASDSMLSRVAGEDVGMYNYLPTNVDGTIHILDADNNDVTKYCNITVYEGSETLTRFVLNINPMKVYVTVREETINRTGRTILPEIIFLTEDKTAVSTTLLSRMKIKFAVPADWTPVEDRNVIEPVALGDVEDDPNFVYITTPGVVTVVYPNNVVAVTPLSNEDSLATANRYVFVGGMLYRTVQIYATNTMDGGDPSRTVTVKLPVTEALYGEDVYLIAARKNGSYSVCEATVSGTDITISDDQFYYVLAAQPEYWPYYILAGVVALAAAGAAVAGIRAHKRVKVRGKKQRAQSGQKAKRQAQGQQARGQARQTQGQMASVAPQGNGQAGQSTAQNAQEGATLNASDARQMLADELDDDVLGIDAAEGADTGVDVTAADGASTEADAGADLDSASATVATAANQIGRAHV